MRSACPNIRRCFVLKRRPSRRVLIVLAALVLLGLAHNFILRGLAWPLVARESPSTMSTWCPADFYCLHGGELGADGFEPFRHAAEWYAEARGRKILLLLPPDSRIVEIGAVRSFERACRSELDKRRIPPADVLSLRAATHDVWGEARAMADWLPSHPAATVVLACSPLNSGRQRYALDKTLAPADAARVRMTFLPDPSRDARSWWRSRAGVKDFMFAWLGLVYAWAGRDGARAAPTAAVFQEEVRARIGEAPP